MQIRVPEKLKRGDEVRVIAPARSLALLPESTTIIANKYFDGLGLTLSFGKHVREKDRFGSSSIESRLYDLHEAFSNPNIKAIFTVLGGYNVNQLLDEIDYDLIASNPKILCGYSDITALQNAIYAKTGLVTYSGLHYSSFGIEKGIKYSIDYLQQCLFSEDCFSIMPSDTWSDEGLLENSSNDFLMENEGHWVLQAGEAEGTILGGNLCTFNLLQGTPFMPSLKDTVLFLEDDALTGADTAVSFDRDLQSLIHQPGFDGVRAIIIGRFQKESNINYEILQSMIKNKKALRDIPIIANVDFGHTQPMVTFPIGGKMRMKANEKIILKVYSH